MQTDVLIVGGGPAGLMAAYEVASRGYSATVVDESWAIGGQMRHQTQVIDYLSQPWTGMRGYQLIASLEERLASMPVKFLLNHEVMGIYADNCVGVRKGTEIFKIEPGCMIIATGAAESAVAFPGWTLPGVMTVGAAQILINRERVSPGEKGLVIGSSDMALEITRQMKDVGINILGVVEKSKQLLAKDKPLIDSFYAANVPIMLETEVVSVNGSGRAEEVVLKAENGSETRIAVDFVCTDGGLHPIMEMFALFECSFDYTQGLGGWIPKYDGSLQVGNRTFAAGQAAGITCQAGVFITGAIAGIGAVDYLEQKITKAREEVRRSYWRQLEEVEATHFSEIWNARMSHISLNRQLNDVSVNLA